MAQGRSWSIVSLSISSIDDIARLCDERIEESLQIEFKACNELKIGTTYRNRKDESEIRQREHVIAELTKDVSSFLNATGGTIIYGINEKNSRADSIDEEHLFHRESTHDNVRPEKVIDWLRSHVSPPPTVNAYSILLDDRDPDSCWLLVIEIPQGDTAYMAFDRRFYKRIGATVRRMEQYEVVDVMNRTRGADLDLSLAMKPTNDVRKGWKRHTLNLSVTSRNFIASEHGAVKCTFAFPIELDDRSALTSFRNSHVASTGFPIESYGEQPHAKSVLIRWGAYMGAVIFPGDWFSFDDIPLFISFPAPSVVADALYLFRIELFTNNRAPKQSMHTISFDSSSLQFKISTVPPNEFDQTMAKFWESYHRAFNELRGGN
jgi:hypothetical protein